MAMCVVHVRYKRHIIIECDDNEKALTLHCADTYDVIHESLLSLLEPQTRQLTVRRISVSRYLRTFTSFRSGGGGTMTMRACGDDSSPSPASCSQARRSSSGASSRKSRPGPGSLLRLLAGMMCFRDHFRWLPSQWQWAEWQS